MASIQLYDPFADAGFDDLFRGFFRPVRFEKGDVPATIKVDVTETDTGYKVQAEIPGVTRDEIQVTIEGSQVSVGAEVKRESERKDGGRVLRSERHFGSVHRSFVLPVEIDEAASEAKYDNGILELKLVRKATQAGRKLTIQ